MGVLGFLIVCLIIDFSKSLCSVKDVLVNLVVFLFSNPLSKNILFNQIISF